MCWRHIARSVSSPFASSLESSRCPKLPASLSDDATFADPTMMDGIHMAGSALRHGKSWSSQEDERLTTAFQTGASFTVLAQAHEREEGAIRARLQRLGLLASDAVEGTGEVGGQQQSTPSLETQNTPLAQSVDSLINALQALKAYKGSGAPGRSAISSVTRAYDKLNLILLEEAPTPTKQDVDLPSDDPLPDRLREAFAGIVNACVSDVQDRYIATRLLGLEGDGERITLQQIGDEFDRTRERIRQRRNRAFVKITAALPRRVASATRLRAVLADVSRDADWTQPAQAARTIVTLVNDNVMAAKQLTLMAMLAAGASGKISQLRRAAEAAALEACHDPQTFGRWQIDRWADATEKAVLQGSFAQFKTLPDDMTNAKRSTSQGSGSHALSFPSAKLKRMVECESGMEFSVYQWLEKSSDVAAYQEQPLSILYEDGIDSRTYYPDAAVLDVHGRVVVVEVKPVFYMFRLKTLRKALGAISYLQPRGIGYLLVDSRGRTLKDLAMFPYDTELAQEIEKRLNIGYMTFKDVKEIILSVSGRFEFSSFVSMIVNRDWGVSQSPVCISKLALNLSFKPLLS